MLAKAILFACATIGGAVSAFASAMLLFGILNANLERAGLYIILAFFAGGAAGAWMAARYLVHTPFQKDEIKRLIITTLIGAFVGSAAAYWAFSLNPDEHEEMSRIYIISISAIVGGTIGLFLRLRPRRSAA